MAGKRRSKKDGSVFQTRSGGWRGYLTLPMGRRKYVSGQTRAEVVARLKALQKEQEAGRDLGSPDQTLATWLTTWLEDTVRRTRAPNTYKLYTETCTRYILPAIGRLKLASLKPDHIQRLLNDLHDSGLSVRTCGIVKNTLRTALSLAVKRGLLVRNPASTTELPKESTPFEGVALSAEQVRRFFDVNQEHPLLPLFRLILALGLRRGEVLALTWAGVDLHGRTLTIQVSKTGKRVVPLTDDLVSLLKAQRITCTEMRLKATRWADPGDWVFPTQVGTQRAGSAVVRTFKAMLAAARLPETIRLHDLRHTAITLMLQHGVPLRTVMSIVGHSQASTTMGYAHSSAETERAALTTLARVYGS